MDYEDKDGRWSMADDGGRRRWEMHDDEAGEDAYDDTHHRRGQE